MMWSFNEKVVQQANLLTEGQISQLQSVALLISQVCTACCMQITMRRMVIVATKGSMEVEVVVMKG